MPSEYYFTDGFSVYGPHDLEGIRENLLSGRISADTGVAPLGATEWTPFHQSELCRLLSGSSIPLTPPPIPTELEGQPAEAGVFRKVQGLDGLAGHGAKLGAAVANLSGKVVGDISELRMQLLLPFLEIRSLSWLKNQTFLGMVIVGLWPIICIQILGQNYLTIYWAIAFYFSAIWALYFYVAFAPEQVTRRRAVGCFFATSLVSIPILSVIYYIPPVKWLLELATGSESIVLRLIGMLSAVAVPEEICKALVLFVLVRTNKTPLQPKTLLFYGLLSGLGFGIYEGVNYQTGRNFESSNNPADYYLLNLMRLTSLPFLHAIWTGIAGYFLAFSALFPSRAHGLVVVAILFPAMFHALHNTLGGFPGLAVDAVSTLTLLIYLSKSSEIEAGLGPAV